MMSCTGWIRTVLIGGLAAALAPAGVASIVTYQATNTSGSAWRYDYVITTEAGEAPLDELTIFFDVTQFAGANLRTLTLPAGWDGLIQQPDPLLPDNGLIDVFTQPAGPSSVAPGASLAGFSITFDWFNAAAPGSQAFDVIDAATFTVLRSGFTTRAAVMQVPEPQSALLLAMALLTLLAASTPRSNNRPPLFEGSLHVAIC